MNNEVIMKDNYDFSNAGSNPYTEKLQNDIAEHKKKPSRKILQPKGLPKKHLEEEMDSESSN